MDTQVRKQNKLVIACLVCLLSIALLLGILLFAGQDLWAQGPSSGGTQTEQESDITSETDESLTSETETEIESETETETEEIIEPEKELTYLETWELDYVEPPVIRNYEEVLAKIKEYSQWFPILHHVYDNHEQYDPSLLAALAGNPEMADFCYGVLHREATVTGGFTEEELSAYHPLLLQWDIRWGYMMYGNSGSNMGGAGCGPTCLSMAALYLTGDATQTPDAVARYSMDNGHYVTNVGTAWALMIEYPKSIGLTGRYISWSEAKLKAELDKGNVIICSVRPGDFTSGGHFILIHAYDENGFKVNDPKCIYRSRLTWTYDQIKDDIKQAWSIGK